MKITLISIFSFFVFNFNIYAENFWQDTVWTRKIPIGGSNNSKITFHPSGKFLFVTSDQFLFKYDAYKGNLIKTYKMASNGYIRDYTFTNDSKNIIIGCDVINETKVTHYVEVWNLDNDSLIWKKYYHHADKNEKILSIKLSKDNKYIYVGINAIGGQLYIIDYNYGEMIETLTSIGGSIDIAPNGNYMVSSYNIDSSKVITAIFDINTWERKIHLPNYYNPKYDPNGKYIIMNGKDIILYSIEENITYILDGHKMEFADVCFTNDGKYIVSAGYDNTYAPYKGGYIVFDINTKNIVYEAPYYTASTGYISISPDNSLYAKVIGTYEIQVWKFFNTISNSIIDDNKDINNIIINIEQSNIQILNFEKFINNELIITNLNGDIMYKQKLLTNNIDISHLSNGLYTCILKSDLNLYSKSFIINY